MGVIEIQKIQKAKATKKVPAGDLGTTSKDHASSKIHFFTFEIPFMDQNNNQRSMTGF